MALLSWSGVSAVFAGSESGGSVGGLCFGVFRVVEERVPSRSYVGRGFFSVGERGLGLTGGLSGVGWVERRRARRRRAGRGSRREISPRRLAGREAPSQSK